MAQGNTSPPFLAPTKRGQRADARGTPRGAPRGRADLQGEVSFELLVRDAAVLRPNKPRPKLSVVLGGWRVGGGQADLDVLDERVLLVGRDLQGAGVATVR